MSRVAEPPADGEPGRARTGSAWSGLAWSERALVGALLICAFSATLSVAVSQIALGLALALALWRWARHGERPVRTGLEPAALLLVGWALLMIPFSGDPPQSLRYARRFYLLAPLWLYATHAATAARRRLVLLALVAGAAAASGVGLARSVRRLTVDLDHRLVLNQNYMTSGGLMMIALLAGLALLLHLRNRRWRVGLGLGLLPPLAALVLTFTRSAWLGLLAGAALIVARRRARLLVPLALLTAAGLALAPAPLRERFFSSFDPSHEHNRQRLLFWETGWRMLRDRPLTGQGDQDLAELYRQYHHGEQVEVQGHLHNNLVMFGAIWGAPGLLIGAGFLAALAVCLERRRRAWRGPGLGPGPGPGRPGPGLLGSGDPGRRAPPPDDDLAGGWNLAALGVWAGFNVTGLFEWNFGDAEILLLLCLVVGMGLAADRRAR